MDHYAVVAEELSQLGEKWRDLEQRVAEVERVNTRLEEAALTTARALEEVSRHWDAVYDAMRRADRIDKQISSERDHDAARARRAARSALRVPERPRSCGDDLLLLRRAAPPSQASTDMASHLSSGRLRFADCCRRLVNVVGTVRRCRLDVVPAASWEVLGYEALAPTPGSRTVWALGSD